MFVTAARTRRCGILADRSQQWLERMGFTGLPTWPITEDVGASPSMKLCSCWSFRNSVMAIPSAGHVYVPSANCRGSTRNALSSLMMRLLIPETVLVQSALQWIRMVTARPITGWSRLPRPDARLTTGSATCSATYAAQAMGRRLRRGAGRRRRFSTFQTFRLQKSPVTFIHQAGAPHGVADSLQIQLAGVIWKEARNFSATP